MDRLREILSRKYFVDALSQAHRKLEGVSYENRARALGFTVAVCGAYMVRGITSGDATEIAIGGFLEIAFAHRMIMQLAQAARKDDWKSWRR
ncbi:MAG: hypothetical protein KGH61_03805 [Candidatus Micrarchaeota archaeon]|nr:hypothetical protein [Candidatus Micrarchaeota archaeon]MDE1848046.1 hypothetical protein [Candidatus Micrarchaeota archaeon]MDE1864723.1 hypothetical protein [Candidatus Micrarchaeota archaeon]